MRPVVALMAAVLVVVGCSETAQKSTAPSSTATPIVHITAAQKAQVQAILQAAMDHYSAEFTAGQVALSHTKNNDFYPWRQSTNIEQDVKTFLDAFSKADANYTAGNEPSAMSSWRDDKYVVQADIVVWVQVAVGWQIGRKADADLAAPRAAGKKEFGNVRAHPAPDIAARGTLPRAEGG